MTLYPYAAPRRGQFTTWYLRQLCEEVCSSADLDKPFWCMAGPMTSLPVAFSNAAIDLRSRGYNIVNPGELGMSYGAPYPQRDAIICSLPKCVGGFLLKGWHASSWALTETAILASLGRELIEYNGPGETHLVINRDERLVELCG